MPCVNMHPSSSIQHMYALSNFFGGKGGGEGGEITFLRDLERGGCGGGK